MREKEEKKERMKIGGRERWGNGGLRKKYRKRENEGKKGRREHKKIKEKRETENIRGKEEERGMGEKGRQ